MSTLPPHGHRTSPVETKTAARPGGYYQSFPPYHTIPYTPPRELHGSTTHLRERHTTDLHATTTHLMPMPEPATNLASPHNYYPNGVIHSPNALGYQNHTKTYVDYNPNTLPPGAANCDPSSIHGLSPHTQGYPIIIYDRSNLQPSGYFPMVPQQQANEIMTCLWIDQNNNNTITEDGKRKPCGKQFRMLQDLVTHLSVEHVSACDSNVHTCYWQDCQRNGLPFTAKYKLVIHIRAHTGKFSPRSEIRRRIPKRTHTGEKLFMCKYFGCGRSFANSSDRKKHSQVHPSNKPYSCNVGRCNKRYTHSSSLRKHIKLHDSLEQTSSNTKPQSLLNLL